MRDPLVLVQLSDLHVGASWEGADAVDTLRVTLDCVSRLADRPDAVLLSGDLTENAVQAEYDLVYELVGGLDVPVYALPGNHDDAELVRRTFALPGDPGRPLRYSVDLGPLRLVLLDSTRHGEDAGRLDAERLEWLDAELAVAPDKTTLLALHHPPFSVGSETWDRIGLPPAERAALGEVVGRHPQVRRVLAGHVHQTIVGEVAGRPALTAPSTFRQARLDLRAGAIELSTEPPGFAVHVLHEDGLVSYVKQLPCASG